MKGIERIWYKLSAPLPQKARSALLFPVRVFYSVFYINKVRKMSNKVTKTALKNDNDYSDYLRNQINVSHYRSFRWFFGVRAKLPSRTRYLVGLMNKHLPLNKKDLSILCVGCRDARELDYVDKICNVKSKGLDLFSEDKRIIVGDMHKMNFKDNKFDAIYTCHCLEHSYNIKIALFECARVVKSGGLLVIEVPINYLPDKTDRWDVKSTQVLCNILEDKIDKVLVSEDTENLARLIVKLK